MYNSSTHIRMFNAASCSEPFYINHEHNHSQREVGNALTQPHVRRPTLRSIDLFLSGAAAPTHTICWLCLGNQQQLGSHSWRKQAQWPTAFSRFQRDNDVDQGKFYAPFAPFLHIWETEDSYDEQFWLHVFKTRPRNHSEQNKSSCFSNQASLYCWAVVWSYFE